MKLAIIALAAAVALSGCASNGQQLGELAKHLNERNCASKGDVTGSAGMLGPSLTGHLEWDCAGPSRDTPST